MQEDEADGARGGVERAWELRPAMWNAHDPPVARLLWALVGIAVVGSVLSLPLDYSIADMLPPLGGLIVVLGSYFAARTLRENEVAQATLMLGGENDAVRIAGVHRLGTVAAETPRFRPYVAVTLGAFADEAANGTRPRRLAEGILEELDQLGESQIATLQTRGA